MTTPKWDYYQSELDLGRVFLPQGTGYQAHLGLRVHQDKERHYASEELFGHVPRGERLYFHAKPFIQGIPRYREIGNAQAWYYPGLGIVMLWEVELYESFRKPIPAQDVTLGQLWCIFEGYVLDRCPGVRQVGTPGWEPNYHQEGQPNPNQRWQDFLTQMGYRPWPGRPGLFLKEV